MNRLKELRTELGMTQEELRQKFNNKYKRTYTAAAISQFENDKRTPETSALIDFADFFGVSLDYLLGRSDRTPRNQSLGTPTASALPPLTPKDEREISKNLENMIESLSGAAAMGDSEDDEDMDMLKASLKQAMVLSKRIAKKKFTPKKYK